ncbi:MAG: universal stress protein [Williamsia sp.]|nr:universal stress protein [Williamsia sp.]
MEKILVPFNGLSTDDNTIHFATYIADLTRSTLTGMFPSEAPLVREFTPLESEFSQYSKLMETDDLPQSINDEQQLDENIYFFKEVCRKRGIRTELIRIKKESAAEIIEESRFADLVILDRQSLLEEDAPTALPLKAAREIFHASECPVMVSPPHFSEINEIVFAYDGSQSAVFAIKQFTYLFPELSETRSILLQVNKPHEQGIKREGQIKEWLKKHYSQIGSQLLHGTVQEELAACLHGKQHAVVVMGAYGRGNMSSFLHESSAASVLRSTNLPLFVSHR